MFAFVAAVLFVVGAITEYHSTLDDYVFWMLLGFAAVAVHFALAHTAVLGSYNRNMR